MLQWASAKLVVENTTQVALSSFTKTRHPQRNCSKCLSARKTTKSYKTFMWVWATLRLQVPFTALPSTAAPCPNRDVSVVTLALDDTFSSGIDGTGAIASPHWRRPVTHTGVGSDKRANTYKEICFCVCASTLLKSLHWLRVQYRITFKILLVV